MEHTKLCLFCTHCEYEEEWDTGTTAGGGTYECSLNISYISGHDEPERMIRIAKNCPDYRLKQEILDELEKE